MRKSCLIVLAATFVALGAKAGTDPAREAKTMCLVAGHIDHTVVVSDTVILYYMKGGKVWQNTLPKACPNLKLENAFTEDIRGDAVCANAQSIRVLRRGTPCTLGDFTPYTPPVQP